jgi:malonyl CoA-acyl carrier protein transacylase/NAD(P)-dependent dehydrogenase (short-subunit alcohol dehydrogenase family)/acyl carrier protein
VENNDIFPQDIIQPLVFIFEYCLARLLMRWKIQPYALIGYSLGEYVAACLAGVFSLEEALPLVAYRGKLMQEIPRGSMLSVPLPEKELEPLLNNHLSIAVANGPSCVVSGAEAAINRLEKQLKKRKYICIRLNISHATHSMMMEPMLKAFEAKVRQIRLNTPKIPFISNPTGQWITFEDATNPKYWVNQLRKTVRFADGLKELLKVKNAVFIEVGPGGDLCNILRLHQDKGPDQLVSNLVRYPQQKVSDVYYLLNRIGRLWLEGVKIDWPGFYEEERRHRISLPTYPFDRQKFGVEADITQIGPSVRTRLGPRQSLSKKSHIEDWFYIFSWKRSGLPPGWESERSKDSSWLIFVDEGDLGSQLSERMVLERREVITVKVGPEFVKVGDGEFVINPKRSDDYHKLLNELKASSKVPNRILHLWGITQPNSSELETQRIDTALYLGYYSLIYLARAIGKQHFTREFHVVILTNNMQMVTGEEELSPEKATVLGTCKVIPQEYSNISCRSVDVVLPEPGTRNWQRLIENLLAEQSLETSEQIITYRGNHRWVQTFEPLRLNKSGGVPPCLRVGGVYLITGGLGDIGLALSGYLAAHVQAKLILTGRSVFPFRRDWEKWLEDHDENDTTSRKIRKIRELEKLGGEVLVTRADTADYKQMQKVIRRAEKKFGKINGVIHAAGVVRGFSLATTIEHIDEAACKEQLNPKVYGLLVLEKLLQNKEIDFCLLTSSLAPVLGGLGYVAYSAANLFMDTFVQRHNQTSPVPWINVNCESWMFDKKKQDNRFGATTIKLALNPEEVLEVFQRILAHGERNQILVSTSDINDRINQWITREPVGSEGHPAEKKAFLLHPRPNLSNPYIAPGNQNEQKLADIWQRFFGIQSVGIFDNFFEIGGDSLKAIELVARINHELGIKLQFSELLKTQTIKLLSGEIENKYKYQTNYPPIEAVEKRDYYPATYVQKAMFMPKNSAYKCRFNLSRVYVLEGKLNLKRFDRALKQLVQRHEVFRTAFHLVNEEIVQKVSDAIKFKVKMVKCDEKEAKKRMKEFVKPFDLSKPPPLRIELLQVENEKNYFLFDMHHIIHDGVSEIIIMKELWALYDGRKLEPVTLQYKDYAAWKDKMFHGGILEKYETYWLAKLKDFKFTQLPADPFNCSMKVKHGVETLKIDKKMYKKMEKFCSQRKITKLTFLVAVFKLVLAKNSGYTDIAIGQRVSTRSHYSLRNTLGCFLEKVVIRSHIDNKETFLDYVSKIDRIVIEAVDNSLYPYELLNEKIRQNNDIPGSELFNIILNYLPAEENNGHVSGSQFKISYFHIKKVSSKYHINLKITDNFENIVLTMKYRSCLYNRDRIKRILDNFLMITGKVLSHNSIKLNDIL